MQSQFACRNKINYAYIAAHQFKYMAKLINMLIYAFFGYGYTYCLIWENPRRRMYSNFNDTHLTRFVCGCIIIYSRSSAMPAVFIYTSDCNIHVSNN